MLRKLESVRARTKETPVLQLVRPALIRVITEMEKARQSEPPLLTIAGPESRLLQRNE